MYCQLPLEKNSIAVGEMPKISGTFYMADNVAKNEANANAFLGAEGCFSLGTSTHNVVKLNQGTHSVEIATSIDRIWFGFGADGYHNNVAPVLPVYAWRRTAYLSGNCLKLNHPRPTTFGTQATMVRGSVTQLIGAVMAPLISSECSTLLGTTSTTTTYLPLWQSIYGSVRRSCRGIAKY